MYMILVVLLTGHMEWRSREGIFLTHEPRIASWVLLQQLKNKKHLLDLSKCFFMQKYYILIILRMKLGNIRLVSTENIFKYFMEGGIIMEKI
jgi:hypothetical protein